MRKLICHLLVVAIVMVVVVVLQLVMVTLMVTTVMVLLFLMPIVLRRKMIICQEGINSGEQVWLTIKVRLDHSSTTCLLHIFYHNNNITF